MARSKLNPLQKIVRQAIRDLSGHPRPEKPITSRHLYTESEYRDYLAEKLQGKTEVNTPVGRIDILTKTELIEVKIAKNWKAAIGQVKSYAVFYPNHQPRIHLFGAITKTSLRHAQSICESENIILTWEN